MPRMRYARSRETAALTTPPAKMPVWESRPLVDSPPCVLCKRLDNATLPIMRLPNELLGEIFKAYSDDWYQPPLAGGKSTGAHPSYYGWVRITHVCFHWRAVALETAPLWSRIPVHSNDSAVSFLQRSQETRLDVSGIMSTSDKDRLRAWSLALGEYSARIATLEIVTENLKDTLAVCLGLQHINTGFASLRRLVLHGCGNVPKLDLWTPPPPRAAPGETFPLLTSLTAKNFSWPVTQRFITAASSLRELDIDCSGFRVAGWETVFNILGELSRLEKLSICGNALPLLPESLTPSKAAVLPSLRSLTLSFHDPGLVSACVLAFLCFPASTSVHVTCLAGSDLVEAALDLALFAEEIGWKLSGKSTLGPAVPLRTLVIRNGDLPKQHVVCLYPWRALDFIFEENKPFTLDDVSGSPPPFTIDTQGFSGDDVFKSLSSFPSTSLVSLVLCGSISVTADSIRLGLGHLTRLSTLCVSSKAVYPVLQALAPCPSCPDVLFPALKMLHVNGVAFHGPVEGAACKCSHFEHLRIALERREKLNKRLDFLLITTCYGVYDKDMAILKKHVGEGFWDSVDLD